MLRNNGFTIEHTAQAVLRSKDFVQQSIRRYKQNKLEKTELSSNNHKLSDKKREAVIKMIQEKSPKDLKEFNFTTQFWAADILKAVLKKKHKIEYKNNKSYYDLFKQAGFSFHKPKTRDFRQDPEKIKKFKGALKKSSKNTVIRMSW